MLKKGACCVSYLSPSLRWPLPVLNHRWTRPAQSGHWHPQPCLKGESKRIVKREWKKTTETTEELARRRSSRADHTNTECIDTISTGECCCLAGALKGEENACINLCVCVGGVHIWSQELAKPTALIRERTRAAARSDLQPPGELTRFWAHYEFIWSTCSCCWAGSDSCITKSHFCHTNLSECRLQTQ